MSFRCPVCSQELMINARRDFLSKGFYEPLREAVYDALSADFPRGGTLLDAGCGECWYTSYFKRRLGESGLEPHVLGVDISKYALECDAIVNIFAPACPQEFSRVLKKDGVFVKAIPLEKHLWELKSAVYDAPYENEVPPHDIEGFRLVGEEKICYTFALESGKDITDLFNMTPYCYKTSQQDREKLEKLSSLLIFQTGGFFCSFWRLLL